MFVVDAPRVASVALGSARSDAESTHVLCRHRDEAAGDFMRRIQRRIARIARSCRIRSLNYVIGAEAARGRSAVPLLAQLMSTLDTGAHLTVAGPGSHQDIVFEWMDALLQRRTNDVAVHAQLYSEGHEDRLFPRSPRADLGVAERSGSPAPSLVGWLAQERRSGSPEHGRRFAS